MDKLDMQRLKVGWIWRKLAYFLLDHIPVGRIPKSVFAYFKATGLPMCGDMILWRLELTLERDPARVLGYLVLLPLFLIESAAQRIIF